MKKLVLLLCLILPSLVTATRLRLGTPVFSGSSCQPDTVKPFLTADTQMFYFGTPTYHAESGEEKSCLLVLPVQPAPGMKVAISHVKIRSSAQLLEQANAIFKTQFFLMKLQTPLINHLFEGPVKGESGVVLVVEEKDLLWSGCGKPADLRMHTSLNVTEGSVQIMSLRVGLQTSPC